MYGINFIMEFKDRLGRLCEVRISRRDYTGATHPIRGAFMPFELSYNQRGDRVRSTSATVTAFATEQFNIDTLMTTDDREFRVDYYVASSLEYRGYVVADFYSEVMDGDRVVQFNVTDGLSSLASFPMTFDYNPNTLTVLYQILERIDSNMELGIAIVSDFVHKSKVFWRDFYLSWQGLTNCRGALEALLTATNSVIFQRKGYWWIFNEYQLALQEGGLYKPYLGSTLPYVGEVISFDSFYKGAIRELMPAFKSSTFVFKYGGGKSFPDNCKFKSYPYSAILGTYVLTDWTVANGFSVNRITKNVDSYTGSASTFGALVLGSDSSVASLIVDENYPGINIDSSPYLKAEFPALSSSLKISLTLTARNTRLYAGVPLVGARYPILVLAKKSGTTYRLTKDGRFIAYSPSPSALLIAYFGSNEFDYNEAVSGSLEIEGVIDEDFADYTIEVRLYGAKTAGCNAPVVVHSACVTFEDSKGEGVIHRVVQSGAFSLHAENEESAISDLAPRGVNGYLYNTNKGEKGLILDYNRNPIAGVSSHGDIAVLPILLHCARQKSKLYSGVRNRFRGDVDVVFDPTALYIDCRGDSFLLHSGKYDALRCKLSGVFEEVKFMPQIKQDFIYTDFGEGYVDDFIAMTGGDFNNDFNDDFNND